MSDKNWLDTKIHHNISPWYVTSLYQNVPLLISLGYSSNNAFAKTDNALIENLSNVPWNSYFDRSVNIRSRYKQDSSGCQTPRWANRKKWWLPWRLLGFWDDDRRLCSRVPQTAMHIVNWSINYLRWVTSCNHALILNVRSQAIRLFRGTKMRYCAWITVF